eukprot:SAG11_NODE_12794_length_685_cov_0.853242_1_plen_208_part_01
MSAFLCMLYVDHMASAVAMWSTTQACLPAHYSTRSVLDAGAAGGGARAGRLRAAAWKRVRRQPHRRVQSHRFCAAHPRRHAVSDCDARARASPLAVFFRRCPPPVTHSVFLSQPRGRSTAALRVCVRRPLRCGLVRSPLRCGPARLCDSHTYARLGFALPRGSAQPNRVASAVARFAVRRLGGVYNLTAARQTPMNFLFSQLSAVQQA